MYHYVLATHGLYRFSSIYDAEWFDGSHEVGKSRIVEESEISDYIKKVNAGSHTWAKTTESGFIYDTWREISLHQEILSWGLNIHR